MTLPSRSLFRLVGEFHDKFDLPFSPINCAAIAPARPLNEEDFQYRYNFLKEEATELLEAYQAGDLEEQADALVDLVYVALGTAHLMNIDFDRCFQEVHEANMRKVRTESKDDPRSKRKHKYDVVKPRDWVPPKLGKILGLFKDGDTVK